MPKTLTILISEDRNSQPAQQKLALELAAALGAWPGVAVTIVPHLYDLAPQGPAMRQLQSIQGDVIVLAWLYPRATYWVLSANGINGRMGSTAFFSEEELPDASASQGDEAAERTIWCFDLRAHADLQPLLNELGRIVEQANGCPVAPAGMTQPAAAVAAARVEETTRYRWYPVIDYARCQNCLECLNFCLFGVYDLDESEQILVAQPDACRPGCPACARVCPAQAIMFPEHHSPSIAGDPRAAADGLNLDLVQLMGSLGPMDLARSERDKALGDAAPTANPPGKDALEDLVEDVDQMEL